MKKKFCFLIFALHFSVYSNGQEIPVAEKTDTAKVYKNIQKFSQRRGFTKFIYGLVFKQQSENPAKRKKNKLLKETAFYPYEGKIIRSINITTLDPFGFDLKDTSAAPGSKIVKAGNSIHKITLPITIKNLLLFKKNDVLDSLKVKESERLIRSQKYVRDVIIYASDVSKNSDSVDVFIRELDLWSLIPDFSISPSRLSFGFNEKNFYGSGHQFKNDYTWNHSIGAHAFSTLYLIPNIKNTYISTSLQYSIDEKNNYLKAFDIERPFYSPFAKWAGGIYFGQQFHQAIFFINDSLLQLNFKYNTQDYWGAKAWQLSKGQSEEERTTNLILSGRVLHVNYLQAPPATYDSLNAFSDEIFYLSGISITTRKFIQDKYIFNYGITEDVPIGKAYGIVGGYQFKNNYGRTYLGAKISWGDYYNFGYTSTNFEYGTFFNSSRAEEGIFKVGINYFSNIFVLGKWKFRQFIKPEYTLGIHRFPNEYITINQEFGFRGFDSPYVYGTKRFLLTLQTQSYAPWNVLGFRFGPYIIASFALVGDDASGFKNKRVYSQLGFGVLIKNEFLVLNTMQLSFAFYPLIPGEGNYLVKVNQFKTTDFGFRDFTIDKPLISSYQ
ncbi:MAG: hypothetical protein ABI855_01330 [Bacteroidota bacterium]